VPQPEAAKRTTVQAPHYHRLWKFAALLVLAMIGQSLWASLRDATPIDFVAYWAAAKLTLTGDPASVYDIAAHRAIEGQAVAMDNAFLPFAYPPSYLVPILPFGLLPYWLALLTWISATLGCYLLAIGRLMPQALPVAIAFPPVLACGLIGQNGFLLAAIWIAAIMLLPRRPFIAGLLFGVLALKPHLGILIPIALMASRNWRAFAGAAIGALGVCATGLALFGMPAWQGFLTMIPLYKSLTAEGLIGWHKMASVYASLRSAGFAAEVGWAAHAAIAGAAAVSVFRIWRGPAEPMLRAATLATATTLISPYLYVYDQVLLIVPIAYLWQKGVHQGLIATLFVIPLASVLLTLLPEPGFNPAPLLPVALLVMLHRMYRQPTAISDAFPSRTASIQWSAAQRNIA
jgi:hypothetical protein